MVPRVLLIVVAARLMVALGDLVGLYCEWIVGHGCAEWFALVSLLPF